MRGVEHRHIGLLLAGAGVVLAVVGVLVYLGAFNWFGRLPGDIRVEREHARLYVPLVTMLAISVAVTLLVNLFRRLF